MDKRLVVSQLKMNLPKELENQFFGTLELIGGFAYFCELDWNRDLSIRVFIHVESGEYEKRIQDSEAQYKLISSIETSLFNEGINTLLADNIIDDSFDWKEMFLNNSHETSIEFNDDGSGSLVYLVMMVGTVFIYFDRAGEFCEARAING